MKKIFSLILVLATTLSLRAEVHNGNCGKNGDNITWELNTEDGLMTLSGQGKMADYSEPADVPWYDYREQIKDIKISSKIENIGKYAFYGCTALDTIRIKNNITSVGVSAFENSSSVKVVILGLDFTYIYSKAFYFGISSKLKRVISKNQSLSPGGIYAKAAFFDSKSTTVPLFIPEGSTYDYDTYFTHGLFAQTIEGFPYSLNVQSNDESKGVAVVEKEATDVEDSKAIVRAEAKAGYVFSKWSDGSTENPYTIDLLDNWSQVEQSLTAIFDKELTFSAKIEGNGTGTLTMTKPEEKSDSKEISGSYFEGQKVEWTLTVANNSFFRGWSDKDELDDDFKALTRSVTLSKDYSVTARVDQKFILTLDGGIHGHVYNVDGDKMLYEEEEVDIYAESTDVDYVFSRWSDGVTENPRTIFITSDTTFTAIFEEGWNGKSSKPDGSGSETDPYKITHVRELKWIQLQVYENNLKKGTYIRVENDINMYGAKWTPIGNTSHPFKSHFNGQHKTIYNFSVDNNYYNGQDYIGLFGYAREATIENVKIRDAQVTGNQNVGALCGGAEQTQIVACDNAGVVSGREYVGGICGSLQYNSKITNCNNNGEVSGTIQYIGGTAGYMSNSTIETSVNNKAVNAPEAEYVGGVVGYIDGNSTVVKGCSSNSTATVTGGKYTGGLVGKMNAGSIVDCSAYGAVTGLQEEIGGLIGTLDGASASQLTNFGPVNGAKSRVGGIIGYANNSTLSQSVNVGSVEAQNEQYTGGLIGYSEASNFTYVVNIGLVKGKDLVGGLAGYHFKDATISHSANYGAVSGVSYVGGLVGEARATLSDCLSAAHVEGSGDNVGAVAGSMQSPQQTKDLLYDMQLCPVIDAIGNNVGSADELSTAEMVDPSSSQMDAIYWASSTKDKNLYPVPEFLSTFSAEIAAAAASAVLFADDDDADNFRKDATLSVTNRAKWTSKGGTQINGTTAKPAIIGPDTLYVTKGNAVKAVPVRVTASAIPSYTLTINAGEHGRVDNAGGKFAEGTEVTVEAIADEGYHFLKWSDNSEENPRTFKVTKDETFTAYFEKDPTPTFTVTITAGAGGTVNSSVNGTHEQGEEIELIATANEGYRFVQWSDGNKVNPRKLIVTQDTTLEASFEEIPPTFYTLTVEASAGGHVDQDKAGTSFQEGSSVTLTAVPDEDFVFVQWEDGSTTNPRTIVINSDKTVKAQFAAIQYWNITVQAEKGGTVNDSVNTKRYKTGEKVLIEAKVNNPEDTAFVQWSDGVTENPRYVTIVSDTVITAQFAKIEYLHITLNAGEGGTVNDSVNTKRYKTGDKVRIEAKPDADHTFFMWSDQERENPRDIILTRDTTITAIFRAIPTYTLSISAGEGGTVNDTVNKTYREGTEVTIEAKADDNHKFYSWSDSIKTNPRKIVMTENITLKALFVEVQKATLWVGTTEGGTTNADEVNGKYEEGAQITVKATPARGFNFVRWSNGATSNSITVTMGTQDIILYPIFITRDCEEE